MWKKRGSNHSISRNEKKPDLLFLLLIGKTL
jgi:hypothetical protein